MARRDLDDENPLFTGATDTELKEQPSTTADSPDPPGTARYLGAPYVPEIHGDLDGDLDKDVEIVAALQALETAALGAGFNGSAAAARAAPPKTGGRRSNAADHAGDANHSGDVDEDRVRQDAAADQGLSA